MKRKMDSAKMQEALKTLRGNTAEEGLLHRLHCVVLVLNGYSASEIARIYKDSPRAVSYWVTRFKGMGVRGLRYEPRPGRPTSLDVGQLKLLQKYVKQHEAQSKPINAKSVSQYIKAKFNIDLTERQCLRILKRLRG